MPTEVKRIILLGEDDYQIIEKLQATIGRDDNIIEIIESISDIPDKSFEVLVYLIKLELILKYSTDYSGVDSILKAIQAAPVFKMLSSSNWKATRSRDIYMKAKYTDLITDYQYLIVDTDYRKFVDLINKKILIINGIVSLQENLGEPFSLQLDQLETGFLGLINSLYYKILQLFIISDYDFRKYNVLHFLEANFKLDRVDADFKLTSDIFHLYESNKLIPIKLFQDFIFQRDYSIKFGYNLILTHHLVPKFLLHNIMENNLAELAKYYKSVKISKVYKIFNITPETIDIEAIVLDMIIKNKLPPKTQIDQINNMILFGNAVNELDPHTLNQFVQDVGKLVNEICLKI